MSTGKKVLLAVFGLMFIGGGINHFINQEFYIQLMAYIMPIENTAPANQLILISGATEIVAGLLLLIPQTRRWGAIFILLHLIVFLPIHVAMCYIRLPLEDPNIVYSVWPRLILQFMLIYWAATFTQKPVNQIK